MKRYLRHFRVLIVLSAMTLLIFDPSTASTGATAGMKTCLEVIIPSLFPFFIISTYLNASLLGLSIPGIHALGRLLHIPAGGEGILLVGLLGGYPVGAQAIAQAYQQGSIDRRTASILLGYCNNAGPAFIFGIGSRIFSSFRIIMMLWVIHVFSALFTGMLLPKPDADMKLRYCGIKPSITRSLKDSVRITAEICGWVIVFKVIILYVAKFIQLNTQSTASICLSGILELSNGCIQLTAIEFESIRFLLCSIFLAFGGICVMLQTVSVTAKLGIGFYIPGKIMQICFSIILSALTVSIFFPDNQISPKKLTVLAASAVTVLILFSAFQKNCCGNSSVNHI